ncbi:MAG: beta-ketoacyl synthase N-terminal-like domain-containing protein, partial [Chitinophagaceae bacterium]
AGSVPQLKAGQKLRILEAGAGTGATSEVIFKKLLPFKDHIEYVYTDLSKSFLLHAEQTYRQLAPYLQTALFDIEQSPVRQGLQTGHYDIVIGANVVHATKDIANTLRNIKAVLKKDGVLLLNELGRTELFTTLTFGLLDGWWLYEDRELRLKGSPGLSFRQWTAVLAEEGFDNTKAYPASLHLPQHIIVAESNGFIKTDRLKATGNPRNEMPESKIVASKANNKEGIDLLMARLVSIAANTIQLPENAFDIEEQFRDYGFDSILGNTLVKNINEALNISLKPTDIFNYPNIIQLAKYIQSAYPNVLEQLSVPEVNENNIEPPVTGQPVKPSSNTKKSRFKEIVKQFAPPPSQQSNDIAIIGISAQFGSANNPDEYWNVLKEGISLIEEVPPHRWDLNVHYNTDKTVPNKTYCKWGSFLKDIDKFDPLFFRISGSEAEMMDPQQRLFLEHCWRALEDAAINPRLLKNSKCGVYVAGNPSDYLDTIDDKAAAAFWGNSSSILASRISYLLDLKGPAISIDTACSSSLVAMDMGFASLQRGDTDIIITGGITIMHTSNFYKMSGRAGMLSADGQCYTFDSRANGFVPGEGIGVVIMKRLADAERDGDRIYGIIKGSLTNQDGTTNGIFAPSAFSQQELEKEVYSKFKIDPETINYVEAHGTGTRLGDPIEFEALTNAFRSYTTKKQYCAIGSVKTNIGHTLMAAGIAGIIKILLSFKHKQIPPTINFREINPLINLADSPFKIQEKLTDWETTPASPRRAAISSFGFSGTNA